MKQKRGGWESVELLSVGRLSKGTAYRGEFSLLKAMSLSLDIDGALTQKIQKAVGNWRNQPPSCMQSSVCLSQELPSQTS